MRSSFIALVIATALILAACSGDDSAGPATTAVESTTAPAQVVQSTTPDTTPDTAPAAEPSVGTEAPLEPFEVLPPGPYDVGVQTVTINAGSARPLTVDIWFPIDDAGDAAPHEYVLIPGLSDVSDNAVDAGPDAISADGPFPLVVYSHGSGGLRYIASAYTEAIAAYGYIVAATDHVGNTALDRLLCTATDGPTTAINRVRDVRAIVDRLTDLESTETAGFVANVDREKIAITGHSLGGFTTYAAVTGFDNDLGSVPVDDRVDAIIPLAPAIGGDRPPVDDTTTTTEAITDGEPEYVDPCTEPTDATTGTIQPTPEEIEAARSRRSITDEQLASITVPAMVIVGQDDTTTPVEPNVTRAWELSKSDPLYRVELVAAQHQSFSNACRYLDLIPTWPENLQALAGPFVRRQAKEGCGDGIMDIERAQDLTNTFAISFLDSIFRGAPMIDPATTAIPDDVVLMSK